MFIFIEELNAAFKRSVLGTAAEQDPVFERLSLKLQRQDTDRPPLFERWDSCLVLALKIEGPLGVLFPRGIVNTCQEIFCCLLRLKRAQVALNEIWTYLRKSRTQARQAGLVETEALRHRISFVIDNVYTYMQVSSMMLFSVGGALMIRISPMLLTVSSPYSNGPSRRLRTLKK